MKLRHIRFLLWATSGLLTAMAILTCAWAFEPPSIVLPTQKKDSAKPQARNGTGSSIPSLNSFAPLLGLDLRQTLDSSAVVQAPLSVKLAGTIMEPGKNSAMFQSADGAIEFKAVGESIGGAEVLEIREDSALVFYHGQKLTLKMESEKHP